MSKKMSIKHYFSRQEITIWSLSVTFILLSFFIFDRNNYLTLFASLIGVTSLILNAKGNPLGQLLTIIFSILYGIISYSFAYYGEMITYLGMTAPMALFALISWLRNPYKGNKAEVKVNKLPKKEYAFMIFLSVIVTIAFYFILKAFNTQNIIPSTISVTTSFLAVYLTFRRSPWFALAYAANDIVLLILWTLAALKNSSYISVDVCLQSFFSMTSTAFLTGQGWKEDKVTPFQTKK